MDPSKRLNALTIAFNQTMKMIGQKAWTAIHFGWHIGPSFFFVFFLSLAPAHPVYYAAHLEHTHPTSVQNIQKPDLSWKEEELYTHSLKRIRVLI
ncbi:MAG: hypothetical protein AMXMBFR16_00450 [Candidatus Uhrbacteria bacterium]